MLIAHLPAGYLLTKAWPRKGRVLTVAALIGAVFPDLDLLWQNFIDHGWFHHHEYWVHIPAFWAMIGAVVFPALAWKARYALPVATVFFAAIALHLLLDALVGGIAWLWPATNELFVLVEIPLVRTHWIWDFLFHWTFLAEIAIWLVAAALFFRGRAARPLPA